MSLLPVIDLNEHKPTSNSSTVQWVTALLLASPATQAVGTSWVLHQVDILQHHPVAIACCLIDCVDGNRLLVSRLVQRS